MSFSILVIADVTSYRIVFCAEDGGIGSVRGYVALSHRNPLISCLNQIFFSNNPHSIIRLLGFSFVFVCERAAQIGVKCDLNAGERKALPTEICTVARNTCGGGGSSVWKLRRVTLSWRLEF